MVFIAGQEPEDVHGNSVAPGDLAGQARQVYPNLGRALTAAGARPDQVAKLTIYAVGCTSAYLPVIKQARVELFGDRKPADTLIGGARLARPESLIEVDAIAGRVQSRSARATADVAAACIACAWLPDRVSDQTTPEAITRVARAFGTGLAWHEPAGR
jgi:enamine deaminase RidA (YjgF/YER057c/UK114 family)